MNRSHSYSREPKIPVASLMVIGAVSSLLAAGGACLTIPFLVWCKVPLRRAIGTAAANGLPIAIAGTAAYVISGMHANGLPSTRPRHLPAPRPWSAPACS
jgi:uncharacterized membrane protein YfcA